MTAFVSLLSSLLVGLVLIVAPWTALWDANYLLQAYPLVRSLLLSEFTRGAVSGLGMVNLLLAASELHQMLTDADEPS